MILHCPDPQNWLQRIEQAISTGQGDCWLWTKSIDRHGYGRFGYRDDDGLQHETGAHRASWLAHRGDIPKGLETDHIVCRNRLCVNPWHLELVTHAVNMSRRVQPKPGEPTQKELTFAKWASRPSRPRIPGQCPRHGEENGYFRTEKYGAHRYICRICTRDKSRRQRARRKILATLEL